MRALLGQASRFAVVGASGTVAYLLLFLLLRPVGAQAAGLLARLLVAGPTTWLGARHVFARRLDWRRAGAVAVGGLLLGAALSSVALAAVGRAGRPVEGAVLGATQLVAAAVRFLLLRRVARTARLTADVQPVHNDLRAGAPTVEGSEGDTSRSLACVGERR